ncbi:hypothetical protein NEMIN01_1479 [Nematocida minor]|uniref:uncharacterized protein n=1 Tax=Nematocida minor TaxID=1912983 RepID=UPI00221FA063|nr:uncharacterized protein NEMIN01_1479 [Nematocida minor]KAI5191320.1 hypothetical protein NEMIN01_1479 [Nematocida minor]
MGRSERKIAVRERTRTKEVEGKRATKPKEKKETLHAKAAGKKEEAEDAERKEKQRENERKRPLKKALDISVREEERRKEEKQKEEEKEKQAPVKGKRGRPRKEPTEPKPAQPRKKRGPNKKKTDGEIEVKVKKEKKEKKIKKPLLPKKVKIPKQRIKKLDKIDEVLNDPSKKEHIKKRIEGLVIEGRAEEIKQIAEYMGDSTRHTIYIHGKPGTGKTYVMEKIGNLLGEENVEVYYSNLLIDKSFIRVESSIEPSITVVLIVDEFEGPKKDKLFIRQKEKLERQFKREERPKYSFKVVFISNEYNSKGVQFKPYAKDSVQQIVEVRQEAAEVESILKVNAGVEQKDLRAVMTKKIEPIKTNNGESIGQYHKFIKEKVAQGEMDVNVIYSEFLQEMKEKGISVMPKEVIQEIIEGYLDGTL